MKIRVATFEDCADLHRVQDAAIRGMHVNKPMEKGIADYLDKREPASFAKEMESEGFIAILDGDKIVGYGALHIPKTEITSVFVDPGHQRKGVGRTILAELERLASDVGIEGVQLQATGTAIVFYLAMGYQSDPPVQPDAKWALMKKKLIRVA